MDLIIAEANGIQAGFTLRPKLHTEKRAELAAQADAEEHIIILDQVHGTRVVIVDAQLLEGQGSFVEIEGHDGAVTNLKGVILTTKHADCIPLYFFDPVKGVIGLSHAGWRGTVGDIASITIDTMIQVYGCNPVDIKAWIGPGIGRCHFEVSEDVAELFITNMPWSREFIDDGKTSGKYMIDLKGVNSRLLKNKGLCDIHISPYCTFCDPEHFYSYRRDAASERHLAWIMRTD